MKVLVCGGRDWNDRQAVWQALYALREDRGELIRSIVEGGAEGADRFGREWANRCGVPLQTFMADWKMHGKAAGPIRNQRMIDEARPDVVLAFPGGRGTADMMRRARSVGIEVIEAGA